MNGSHEGKSVMESSDLVGTEGRPEYKTSDRVIEAQLACRRRTVFWKKSQDKCQVRPGNAKYSQERKGIVGIGVPGAGLGRRAGSLYLLESCAVEVV